MKNLFLSLVCLFFVGVLFSSCKNKCCDYGGVEYCEGDAGYESAKSSCRILPGCSC